MPSRQTTPNRDSHDIIAPINATPIRRNNNPSRSSPRQSRIDYAFLNNHGRIDPIIANPRRTQSAQSLNSQFANSHVRTPSRLRHASPVDSNNGTEMDIDQPDEEDELESPSRGRGLALPTTVTLRKAQSATPRSSINERTWTIDHFNITFLDRQYKKKWIKDKPTMQDRRWSCKYCQSFYSDDSKRQGSSSNLIKHLKDKHHYSMQDHLKGEQVKYGTYQPMPGSIIQFVSTGIEIHSPEEAALRYIVQTNQSFMHCEHNTWSGLYRSVNSQPPFKARSSLRRFAEKRFNEVRSDQAKLIAATCQSISIAFDGWTSANHKHIIGAVGYWITPDWKRKAMNIEYAEASYGKSGEAMAEILFASLGKNYSATELIDDEDSDGQIEQTTAYIGLNCLEKIIAVCADNATNNDTFCDHFYRMICDEFPASSGKRKFKGRESRIRCLAHIIALIAGKVYNRLEEGSQINAKELVHNVLNEQGGEFPPNCEALTIWQKMRLFVLWINRSEDSRKEWKKYCPVSLPLDVVTRWNSLYLMINKIRNYRDNIEKFARYHRACKHLIPTNHDWLISEQLDRVLEPFYNHTLSVSRSSPSLPDYIGIMWGLNDVLEDVKEGVSPYTGICEEVQTAIAASREVYDKYTTEMNDNIIYFAAHALDPRLKLSLIREQYGSLADDLEPRIKQYLKREYPPTQRVNNIAATDADRPPSIPIHTWALIQRAESLTNEGVIRDELDDWDRYFTGKPVRHNTLEVDKDDEWLLEWWKHHAFEYPACAIAARDLLAIPSAEVDIERLFSEGRDTLGVRRMAQDAQTMRISRLLKSEWDSRDKVIEQERKKRTRRRMEAIGPRVVQTVANVDGST